MNEPLKDEHEEAADDNEHAIVKHLLCFEDDKIQLSIMEEAKIYFRLVFDAIKFVPILLTGVVTNTAAQGYMNLLGDVDQQAAFGIMIVIYVCFFTFLMMTIVDKLGIEISNAFGAKDYHTCKVMLGKGYLTFFTLFLAIPAPIFFFSEQILIKCGINSKLAALVQPPLRVSILGSFFQILGDGLQTACISQGFEHYFGYIGLFSGLGIPIVGYFFMVYLRMGAMGYMISRITFEACKLVYAWFIYKKTHIKSQGLGSFEETIQGFKPYFVESVKMGLASYIEILGGEMAGFLISLGGHNDQIAAYYCTFNLTGYAFIIGLSFSMICRTRMNILIGMGYHKAAKRFYIFFVEASALLGFPLIFLGLEIKDAVVSFYSSSNPSVSAWMHRMVLIYLIIIPSELTYTVNAVAMKTLGHVNLLLRNAFFTLFLGNSTIGVAFHLAGLSAPYIFGLMLSLAVANNLLAFFKAASSDWSRAGKRKGSVCSVVELLERELPLLALVEVRAEARLPIVEM